MLRRIMLAMLLALGASTQASATQVIVQYDCRHCYETYENLNVNYSCGALEYSGHCDWLWADYCRDCHAGKACKAKCCGCAKTCKPMMATGCKKCCKSCNSCAALASDAGYSHEINAEGAGAAPVTPEAELPPAPSEENDPSAAAARVRK